MHTTITTSERVKLLTEVGRRLGAEKWSVIDLTLRQFALPTADDWRGDTLSYVLEMTEGSDDERLIELASHLGIDVGRRSALEPTFWAKGQFRLFISHITAIKSTAAEIQAALAKYGVSAFVAHNDIVPTREWQDEIELALSSCDALVALMSPGFHESKWTDQEVGFAMGRGILIVSVALRLDPYGFIGKFQALNGHARKTEDLARAIFESLLTHKQTRERTKEGLVARLEQAGSFSVARDTMGLIEKVPDWSAGLKARMSAAAIENYEVASAFTVPERIKKLAESKA